MKVFNKMLEALIMVSESPGFGDAIGPDDSFDEELTGMGAIQTMVSFDQQSVNDIREAIRLGKEKLSADQQYKDNIREAIRLARED